MFQILKIKYIHTMRVIFFDKTTPKQYFTDMQTHDVQNLTTFSENRAACPLTGLPSIRTPEGATAITVYENPVTGRVRYTEIAEQALRNINSLQKKALLENKLPELVNYRYLRKILGPGFESAQSD
jgi:hypothetical protein